VAAVLASVALPTVVRAQATIRVSEGDRAGSVLREIAPGTVSGPTLDPFSVEDTAPKRIAQACGTARVCVPGWDLRLVSVRLPAAEVPRNVRVPVTLVVENRGRTAAPVSEVQICAEARTPCGALVASVPVPALGPGEQLRVVVPYQSPGSDDALIRLFALIDPDNATKESNRTNNAGQSEFAHTRRPSVVIAGIETPREVGPDGELPIVLRVRNPSAIIPAPATVVTLRGMYHSERYAGNWPKSWGGRGIGDVPVPRLLPGQEYRVELVARTDHGVCTNKGPTTATGSVEAAVTSDGLWTRETTRAVKAQPWKRRVC
jgi:hypothetical protein